MLVLALAVVGWQFALGYFTLRNNLESDSKEDLDKYLQMTMHAIQNQASDPVVDPAFLPRLVNTKLYIALAKNGQVYQQFGEKVPSHPWFWVSRTVSLGRGYTLQLELDKSTYSRSLREYVGSSFAFLPLSLILAIALAWLLQKLLMRPLLKMEVAAQVMARERFPEPLREGPGDIGRLIHAFNSMVRRVRSALERERAFTRYASHELRTPLTALRNYTGALQQGAMPLTEVLPAWSRNLDRIENTLIGLLGLTRINSEDDTLIWLPELVWSVTENLNAGQLSRLVLELDSGHVRGPREALLGAVRNLVENALRYSQGLVWVETKESPTYLRVRDQGPGVPEDKLEQITQPFVRLSNRLEGTGLGLAYVRQVAETVGGEFHLRNHPSGGLEATLIFSGSPSYPHVSGPSLQGAKSR